MHGYRNFRLGVSRLSQQKIPFDNVFIIFYLTLVLNLFSVILSFFRKAILLKGSSWGPTFSKGGVSNSFFQGKWGSTLISIETLGGRGWGV